MSNISINRLKIFIFTQEIVEIRERFEEDNGEKSEGDIFDKIIENRINEERVRSLERKLEEGVEAIDRTRLRETTESSTSS